MNKINFSLISTFIGDEGKIEQLGWSHQSFGILTSAIHGILNTTLMKHVIPGNSVTFCCTLEILRPTFLVHLVPLPLDFTVYGVILGTQLFLKIL